MSRLEGGIFSRPRGKTGGVVFGAGRTREGKLVTSRLLVIPSNPNTAGQQSQRSIFTACLAIVRALGPAFYQSDWNRAIAQLPGFQSLMSIFMNSMDAAFALSAPPTTNLGALGFPSGWNADPVTTPGSCVITWDGTVQTPNHASDLAVCFAIQSEPPVGGGPRHVVIDTTALRSAGTKTLTLGTVATDFLCGLYFRGAVGQATEGMLSVAQWMIGEAV